MGIIAEFNEAIQLFNTIKDKTLSEKEKEILSLAFDNDGEIIVFNTDEQPFIRIGNKSFNSSPRKKAEYRRGLAELIKKGFVEHWSGVVYILTADGWEKSEKISE